MQSSIESIQIVSLLTHSSLIHANQKYMKQSTTSAKTGKPASEEENFKGIENHKKAAKHHELAAKNHHDAAKHHEQGNHDKASESTVKAQGHNNLATEYQQEDAKHHAMHS